MLGMAPGCTEDPPSDDEDQNDERRGRIWWFMGELRHDAEILGECRNTVLLPQDRNIVRAGRRNPVRQQEVRASPALADAGCGDELRPALFELVREADHGGGIVVHRVENHS